MSPSRLAFGQASGRESPVRRGYPGDMYVPGHFAVGDLAKIEAFVDRVGAADLVTFDGTRPVSTLLPVIWERSAGPNGRLIGHIALNNPQWSTAARRSRAGDR